MVLLILSIICILLAFRFPDSRKITLLLLALMWILFALNYANADYQPYYSNYNKVANGDFTSFESSEEGFVLLMYLFGRILHLTYQQFLMVVSAVSVLVLGYCISKLTDYQNIALALFLINPYWIMIVQVRFFLAFLVVLAGFTIMTVRDDTLGFCLFVLFVLVSGFFHRAGFICIIFAFARMKSLKRVCGVSVLIGMGLLFFKSSFGQTLAKHFLSIKKVATWLGASGSRSLTGVLSLIFVHAVILAVTIYLYKRIKDQNPKAEYLLKLSIICYSILPLECFDKNYERFFRFALLMAFLMFAQYLASCQFQKWEMSLGTAAFLSSFVLYMAFFSVSFGEYYSNSLIPILTKNLLFGR